MIMTLVCGQGMLAAMQTCSVVMVVVVGGGTMHW